MMPQRSLLLLLFAALTAITYCDESKQCEKAILEECNGRPASKQQFIFNGTSCVEVEQGQCCKGDNCFNTQTSCENECLKFSRSRERRSLSQKSNSRNSRARKSSRRNRSSRRNSNRKSGSRASGSRNRSRRSSRRRSKTSSKSRNPDKADCSSAPDILKCGDRWYFEGGECIKYKSGFGCSQFIRNSFKSVDECLATCSQAPKTTPTPAPTTKPTTAPTRPTPPTTPPGPCSRVPQYVECNDRWYFNSNICRCEQYLWGFGNCPNDKNTFVSKEECSERCQAHYGGSNAEECQASPAIDTCCGDLWYNDQNSCCTKLEPWVGCYGDNCFSSFLDCHETCHDVAVKRKKRGLNSIYENTSAGTRSRRSSNRNRRSSNRNRRSSNRNRRSSNRNRRSSNRNRRSSNRNRRSSRRSRRSGNNSSSSRKSRSRRLSRKSSKSNSSKDGPTISPCDDRPDTNNNCGVRWYYKDRKCLKYPWGKGCSPFVKNSFASEKECLKCGE